MPEATQAGVDDTGTVPMDAIAALIETRMAGDGARDAMAFIRAYYAGGLDELPAGGARRLAGAALGHMAFARTRHPGETLVDVFNPDIDRHGWQSRHSVVMINTDDRPFLVDSVVAALNQMGLALHGLIHPIVTLRRDDDGRYLGIAATDGDTGDGEDQPGRVLRESFMLIEVTRQPDAEALARIRGRLVEILGDVALAVDDWRQMRDEIDRAIADIEALPDTTLPDDIASEHAAFLRWIRDDNFTFLGFQDCRFAPADEHGQRRVDVVKTLGVMDGRTDDSGRERPRGLAGFTIHTTDTPFGPDPVTITKSRFRATVHRAAPMDYIGVKTYGPDGTVEGERLFLGLFTSVAYHSNPRAIPLIRRKVASIVARAGFAAGGHDAKALLNVLETYPRDELLQIGEDDLLANALGILKLQLRQRLRLFLRRDAFGRFWSALVYVPRDAFDGRLRRRILAELEAATGGTLAEEAAELAEAQISEAPLARLRFVLMVAPEDEVPAVDVAALERRLARLVRGWSDELREALVDAVGEERGLALWRGPGRGLPAHYADRFGPEHGVADLLRLDALGNDPAAIAIAFYTPVGGNTSAALRLKLARPGGPIALSDVLPMIENLGFRVIDEQPYPIEDADAGGAIAWLHDFGLIDLHGAAFDPARLGPLLEETLARVWRGEVENDRFNALVLRAGLTADEVVILRALYRYMRQIGLPFAQSTVEQTLTRHGDIARLIVQLFHARLDPARHATGSASDTAEAEAARLVDAIAQGLDAVVNVDEDRILSRYRDVVLAALRTNAYQRDGDGGHRPVLAIKLDGAALPDLPPPRPFREIFVYSPRVEAVHLRGGRVARGGIRWSDRLEDFRTEILGLMKAQMVKNAVIVPTGAKGGFIVKRPPATRPELQAEVIGCYRDFVGGMLDITDNLKAGALMPPASVHRRDGDDPYLVVAADKGTASFSDIANGIAEERGFWLGDAFASGGSAGYDHKKMAITARGAWVSVRRHFREAGVDVQSDPASVIGVGDMGGDVFGNGLLRSESLRLVGAFNHLHIFLDPAPDPALSFAERARLFTAARSGWGDYDPAVLSPGGRVYDRSAKTVETTPEIRALLGITETRIAPTALIRAMLRASVDLLWFGGIGTFVRATHERDADAGDRTNDALRVTAAELGAKVVGEGANLGFTQAARIEYALAGGRINTDAIDNSGGVDCSDHEVNIKILLGAVLEAGDMTRKQRDLLLGEMTEEVAGLVLANNELQNQVLSVERREAFQRLDRHARLLRGLEAAGVLDRQLERLPDEAELARRARDGLGLTRPELSVLLAYAKIELTHAVAEDPLLDDPALVADLQSYFPQPIAARFPDHIARHPLRREILATHLINEMVNRGGPCLARELADETGQGPAEILRAYVVARDVLDLKRLWAALDDAEGRMLPARRLEALDRLSRRLTQAMRWLLVRGGRAATIGEVIARFQPTATRLSAVLDQVLPAEVVAAIGTDAGRLAADGLDDQAAHKLSQMGSLVSAFDLAALSETLNLPVDRVAPVYYAVDPRLRLHALRHAARAIVVDDPWERLAVTSVIDDLYGVQRRATATIFARDPGGDVEVWATAETGALARAASAVDEVLSAPAITLAMLIVAARRLTALAGG
ncbi:NAD-glutamate dehydrogenase [Tistrella sp. BH-R2-4]|uniref:NAD-glutamate dehydrogenase n=1 Tax=Tistrella arctica TaxID=3133430 RepID=A0ABU9YJK6_9PROT